MSQVGQEGQTWPGGLTYVFQGTVAEDATAGTHICTLTVTPGVGNEMQFLGGFISVGNTATAQTPVAVITDGTNIVQLLLGPASGTTASVTYGVPDTVVVANAGNHPQSYACNFVVSGAMQLVLKVTTAAVSVTQTFAVVCRIHGAKPTAVLADTVGTPTLTTNTDAVF